MHDRFDINDIRLSLDLISKLCQSENSESMLLHSVRDSHESLLEIWKLRIL
jgi:hypothetical protein